MHQYISLFFQISNSNHLEIIMQNYASHIFLVSFFIFQKIKIHSKGESRLYMSNKRKELASLLVQTSKLLFHILVIYKCKRNPLATANHFLFF